VINHWCVINDGVPNGCGKCVMLPFNTVRNENRELLYVCLRCNSRFTKKELEDGHS